MLDNSWTVSNVDPGGFEAASFSVPRDLPQTIRGQNIRLDCGLKVAWEGRVSQVQRSLGARTSIICEGYGALFKDLAKSMVFVDRDLTKWQSPSLTRQITIANAHEQLTDAQVAADPTNNLPALVQSFGDSWVSPNIPLCEALYDSGPNNLISQIYYNTLTGADAFNNIAGLVAHAMIASDDTLATTTTGSSRTTLSGFAEYLTAITPWRYGALQFFTLTTGQGAQGGTYKQFWRNLAVYGNHGLTGRGSDPVGFYPSDIINWCEQQIPGLQAGIIQATDGSGYILPHSVYYTPVGLDTIVNDMAVAQGWHWGVWESLAALTGNATPRVDFRPRAQPGAPTAFCRRQDCDQLDIREDLSQQFNKAVVTYTDTAGRSGAVTVTVDNPILDQAGIAERDVEFSGGTMTSATATVFGAEALLILNAQQRVAGSADIISPIDQGGPAPALLLKSGLDRLRVGDLPSTDAFGTYNDLPISRVECSGSETGLNTSVEFGSGSSLVETLQARFASATTRSGQGGG